MPNDLDDFLKRAAALRQQKAAEQRALAAEEAARAARAAPPAYSDRHRERHAEVAYPVVDESWDADDDEPILMGEVVSTENTKFTPKVATPAVTPIQSQNTSPSPVSAPRVATKQVASSELHEMMLMLMRPGGARQAFLMKEIFDRKKF